MTIAYDKNNAYKYIVEIRNSETLNVLRSFTTSTLYYGGGIGMRYGGYSMFGKYIAIALGKEINIWEIETGNSVRILKGHKGDVFKVCYSPDGLYIVSTSVDQTAIIWDSNTGNRIRTIGEYLDVKNAFIENNNKLVVYSSSENIIKIWNGYTGELLQVIKRPDAIKAYTDKLEIQYKSNNCSPDGKYMATNRLSDKTKLFGDNKKVYILERVSKKICKTIEVSGSGHLIGPIHYIYDGKFILVFYSDSMIGDPMFYDDVYYPCKLNIYKSNNLELLHKISIKEKYLDVYLRDIYQVQCIQKNKCFISTMRGLVFIIDIERGCIIHKLNTHSHENTLSYNDDCSILASASKYDIKLWDVATGNLINTIDFMSIDVKGADVRRIRHDELKTHDFMVLKQNGAIVEGIKTSC